MSFNNQLWSHAASRVLLKFVPAKNEEKFLPSEDKTIAQHRFIDELSADLNLATLKSILPPQLENSIKLTSNIIILGCVKYDRNNDIEDLSLQSYVSDCEDIFSSTSKDIKYYRLDYQPCAPGHIFSEPIFHLHTNGAL